jgi:hypothetical protein
MQRDVFGRLVVSLGVFFAGACDAVDDPGSVEDASLVDPGARAEVNNAQRLNAAVFNGTQLNGIQFNGIQFNGIQFNGIQFNGIQFNGIQFNGSSFSGTIDVGNGPEPRSGTDFIGAEMSLAAGETTYTLRFDDIFENPDQPGQGVYFHKISIKDDAVGTWDTLCRDPAGAPTEAILMANYWDYTSGARVDDPTVITFACRKAVLAKCVEWGYVPWRTATMCQNNVCNEVSLKEYHQACTRMARADYCGDGRSYTFNGTPIDMYDPLSPRLNTRSTGNQPGWGIEAEWGPNGATCVGDDMRMTMYDDHGVPYTFPSCVGSLAAGNCGSFDAARPTSRLANAYCSPWESDPSACAAVNDDPIEG